jgi:hypothetical protein
LHLLISGNGIHHYPDKVTAAAAFFQESRQLRGIKPGAPEAFAVKPRF